MVKARIIDALEFIDADDRNTWVRIGMALQNDLGDKGFELWDSWSRRSSKYRENDARTVWRSFKRGGGIGASTLFHHAKRNGWRASTTQAAQAKPVFCSPKDKSAANEKAVEPQKLMRVATRETHMYLKLKGFADLDWWVHRGKLVVPIFSGVTGELCSLQFISARGQKQFLTGSKVAGGFLEFGEAGAVWLCEGFATGLSIFTALTEAGVEARVRICFSGHNLANVEGNFVVADGDESGAGGNYALATGLPWWMPPGGDANDFHLENGLDALGASLKNFQTNCQ